MKASIKYVTLTALAFFSWSCQEEASENLEKFQASESFKSYWYQGLAEINLYDLEQSRYGEIRKGRSVSIFVTEPFRTDKQVKNEKGNEPSTSVLKQNHIKRFTTGLYDYSMMNSVFTPVDFRKEALKVTHSSQDWCGQSFHQLNYNEEAWFFQQFSYFEEEGDRNKSLGNVFLEDALFNTARLSPELLPTGDFQIFPNSFTLRLLHLDPKPIPAKGTLNESEHEFTYTLATNAPERKVILKIANQSPFQILEIQESYKDGFSENAEWKTSKMKLDTSFRLPYWKLNSLADSIYRLNLDLDLD